MFGLEPTPFDVRLVAFRIPIRVHPSFWIAGVLLNHEMIEHRLDQLFLWIMCLFVSILVHELGHALIAEAFGWPSEIVLYWCGGVAMSQRYHNRTAWRDIAVSLAGPFAGFGLFGLTFGVMVLLRDQHVHRNVDYVLGSLLLINLFWGLVNLLPVLPLDGGHVCHSLLTIMGLRDPARTSMGISVVVAGAAAFVFFSYFHENFAGMLFAMLCLQNFVGLQSQR